MKTHLLTLGGIACVSFGVINALCYGQPFWLIVAVHAVLMTCVALGYVLALVVESQRKNTE